MELSIIWFVLIAVLWIGYFVLEGFDYGVGMLVPVLGRDADPAVAERDRSPLVPVEDTFGGADLDDLPVPAGRDPLDRTSTRDVPGNSDRDRFRAPLRVRVPGV